MLKSSLRIDLVLLVMISLEEVGIIAKSACNLLNCLSKSIFCSNNFFLDLLTLPDCIGASLSLGIQRLDSITVSSQPQYLVRSFLSCNSSEEGTAGNIIVHLSC